MSRIYLSPPDVRQEERTRLLAALDSGWVAPAGPNLEAFDAALAERCQVPHAVALSSGTAALHLALLTAGVHPGSDVIVPSFTFAATANAVAYCGARPCFVDSEGATWNLSPDLLAEEFADRRRRNDLPAAVVTVDLYGQCADYDAIVPLCAEFGVPVIEDAAEALGATWNGRPAGSFGQMGVLSFNGNKIITTSGGGATLCHDQASADRIRYLATQARQPTVHYEHTEIGFNYRLSGLLGAFGQGQLATLDDRVARRRAIRQRYCEALAGLPGVSFAPEDGRGRSNGWLTCIILDPGVAAAGPEELRLALEDHDIESRPLWKPLHAQPAFARSPSRLSGLSDRLFATGLCLPSGSGLDDESQDRVIGAAAACLGARR